MSPLTSVFQGRTFWTEVRDLWSFAVHPFCHCCRCCYVLAAIEKSARSAGMSSSLAEQYAQQLLNSSAASSLAGVYWFVLLQF